MVSSKKNCCAPADIEPFKLSMLLTRTARVSRSCVSRPHLPPSYTHGKIVDLYVTLFTPLSSKLPTATLELYPSLPLSLSLAHTSTLPKNLFTRFAFNTFFGRSSYLGLDNLIWIVLQYRNFSVSDSSFFAFSVVIVLFRNCFAISSGTSHDKKKKKKETIRHISLFSLLFPTP